MAILYHLAARLPVKVYAISYFCIGLSCVASLTLRFGRVETGEGT